MDGVLIYHSDRYAVRSWRNGLWYCVFRLSDMAEVFFQGDDAAQFHDDVLKGSRDFDEAIAHFDEIMIVPKRYVRG